ncbi:hypothetical protein [Natronobacterium gregoryi]|uniref:Uncharacterized protein n=2 Tax=Natronobacterium gregoryi TaxID=44930 RepID=L0AGI9_NATGS|nr:hypothetical protein [Natronobacterium gregoryi]AFZ73023.1 hypothetical protein Natgr_1838 [Natronobacterium gregoryi SP2]ELY70714.1 hypothetical protein C490_06249 [Natronobacterium gregoryi SP2]PLK20363.1 hypothetical protein CYV19_09995 [Natronobacterium gregoryi SP2]SFI63359.1 hypothetical protein SAMN05443661_102243 [Natronobacterium gregoryi]
MIGRREYSGGSIDATYQSITERPELDEQADRVEYATEPEPTGEERTEGVPDLNADQDVERPDAAGQTTFEDWGWSA